VEVFDQPNSVLSIEEFRARLRDPSITSHTVLLNCLLERRSLEQAEWLVREHAGEIAPDSIRKELLTPEVLARKPLETLLLDTMWRGDSTSRNWAFTRELGVDLRNQLIELHSQIQMNCRAFNVLAAWLDPARLDRGGKFFILSEPPPEVVSLDFEQQLTQFKTQGNRLDALWRAQTQVTGNRLGEAAGNRAYALEAFQKYVKLAAQLQEISQSIWREAKTPVRSRTRNLDKSKYADIGASYAKSRTVISELQALEERIPWLDEYTSTTSAPDGAPR